jgi:hypothetical protein
MSKVMNFAQILMDRQRHQASTLPGKSERHRKGGNRLHHCSFGSQLVVDLLNFMAEEKYVCVCVTDRRMVTILSCLQSFAARPCSLHGVFFFVMRVGALSVKQKQYLGLHTMSSANVLCAGTISKITFGTFAVLAIHANRVRSLCPAAFRQGFWGHRLHSLHFRRSNQRYHPGSQFIHTQACNISMTTNICVDNL